MNPGGLTPLRALPSARTCATHYPSPTDSPAPAPTAPPPVPDSPAPRPGPKRGPGKGVGTLWRARTRCGAEASGTPALPLQCWDQPLPPCPHVAVVTGLGASVGAVPDGWGAAIGTPRQRTWGGSAAFRPSGLCELGGPESPPGASQFRPLYVGRKTSWVV